MKAAGSCSMQKLPARPAKDLRLKAVLNKRRALKDEFKLPSIKRSAHDRPENHRPEKACCASLPRLRTNVKDLLNRFTDSNS